MSSRQATLKVYTLGETAYGTAREIQETVAERVHRGDERGALLFLEHPHTYTFGRRGDLDNLLWDQEELNQRGIAVHWIDRGGDVTYHGPGQLVGYPILPLGQVNQKDHLPQADYVGYIRRLEEVLIRALARLGLVCCQRQGFTGIWIQPDVASRCHHCPPAAREQPSKIASIGVKVDTHGISRHGFALNVDPDMSFWDGIIACGLIDHPTIALADLLQPVPSMNIVMESIIDSFVQTFGFDDVSFSPWPESWD
jgi:lipoate-protein ligase B